MSPFHLACREMQHRWKSSLVVVLLVAVLTGTLAWFLVDNTGYQKEVSRNVRDIGSNVVILPATVNPMSYHTGGGYSDMTMPQATVDQLLQHNASLNHLIPILERKAEVQRADRKVEARLVGLAASIPMPGRPKAPMQRAIPEGEVQLGSHLANALGVARDTVADVQIFGRTLKVNRVNRNTGTWQDAAALMDLETVQNLCRLPGQISRIEAIECTDEQCAATGMSSEAVLATELARITDQAILFRRDQMAAARSNVRRVSAANFQLLQKVLWVMLVLAVGGLTALNVMQRRQELGTLFAVGYGAIPVAGLLVLRSAVLTLVGSVLGVMIGGWLAQVLGQSIFLATGSRTAIDWWSGLSVAATAVLLASIASSLPALLAVSKNPADLVGKEV